MTITSIRFRTEGALIVLQVEETTRPSRSEYYGSGNEDKVAWRDAKVEDMLDVSAFTNSTSTMDRQIASLEHTVEYLQQQIRSISSSEVQL